jgi:hypothetical protein
MGKIPKVHPSAAQTEIRLRFATAIQPGDAPGDSKGFKISFRIQHPAFKIQNPKSKIQNPSPSTPHILTGRQPMKTRSSFF